MDFTHDAARRELSAPAGADRRDDLGHQLVEVHGLERTSGARTAEILKTPDHPGAFECHALDHADGLHDLLILHVCREDLGSRQDAGEGVGEVVRHLAGHLAEGIQALLLHGLPISSHEGVEVSSELADVRSSGHVSLPHGHRAWLRSHLHF